MTPELVGEMVCVLFHEPNNEPPVRLCRALGNKNIQIRTCTDQFTALSMLCRAVKEGSASLNILLLVEPERLPGAAELVELAGVYAPKSVCWIYTESPHEQVREVRAEDLAEWRANANSTTAPTTATGGGAASPSQAEPKLRIVNDPGGVDRATVADSSGSGDPPGEAGRRDLGAEAEEPGPVLTDEELSMLLADEHGEHGQNGGHG